MSVLLSLLISLSVQTQEAADQQGVAIAQRLVAAIKGKAEFQDTDFAKKLRATDKAALRKFGECRVGHVGNTMRAHPERPNVLVRNPNDVAVTFGCRGVPSKTPVGISLHLQDGKIMSVEIHNADLMRAK